MLNRDNKFIYFLTFIVFFYSICFPILLLFYSSLQYLIKNVLILIKVVL